MSALLSSLPAPVHAAAATSAAAPAAAPAAATRSLALSDSAPPPYLLRAGFVPRKPADFGDGGAYPECHVAQYPLDCGRKAAAGDAKTGIVAVSVAEDGSVDYDALVKQGSNANKIVATKHSALVPKLHDRTAEVPKLPLPHPRTLTLRCRTLRGQSRRKSTPL